MYQLVQAIWLILPAYAANGLAPIARGKRPIDFDRKFFDGQPLFGRGKTWEGLAFGVVVGTAVAMIMNAASRYLQPVAQANGFLLLPMTPALGLLLSFGAMFGDLCGSFIKRRMKLARGASAPLLDQLDFVFGAMFMSALAVPPDAEIFLLLIIITPVVHLFANCVGYLWKVKNEPW